MRLLLKFTRSHCFFYLLSHLLFISSSATFVKNTSKAAVSKFRNGVAVTDTANCKLVPSQRYPGLFVSSSKIRRVTTNSSILFSDSYQISSVLTRIPVNISTESIWGTTTTTSRPNFRITGDPCCTTTMSMTVPSTVSPKYNLQQEFTVKQLASSYQIIHESQCANPGAACTLSGVCKLAYRVQWVLVEGYDGSDMFIPVEVGNHCYCQYR